MRSNVQGCVLALVFLLNLPAICGESPHDASRLEQVVAAQQGHTTVQGRLRWLTSRVDDPTAPVREQHVRFFLAFPQRYFVSTNKPGDDAKTIYVSDGTTRWELTQLFAGDTPDKKKLAAATDEDLDQRLLACFRFDLQRLRQDFAIVAVPTADSTVITLTPLAENLKQQLTMLVLTFDAKHVLTAIRSEDPQGNRHDFSITEAVYDQPIDNAIFSVAP